jgi:hypothetical protein
MAGSLVNNELEKMWKGALSWHLPGGTENYKKPLYKGSWSLGLNLGLYNINRGSNHSNRVHLENIVMDQMEKDFCDLD